MDRRAEENSAFTSLIIISSIRERCLPVLSTCSRSLSWSHLYHGAIHTGGPRSQSSLTFKMPRFDASVNFTRKAPRDRASHSSSSLLSTLCLCLTSPLHQSYYSKPASSSYESRSWTGCRTRSPFVVVRMSRSNLYPESLLKPHTTSIGQKAENVLQRMCDPLSSSC